MGEAIARMAVRDGLQPILAGRNESKLASLAEELSVDFKVAALQEAEKLITIFDDTTLVLNCAGPFKYTYQPIVEACLATRTHYLDITGELPVFQAISDLDQEARNQGVMLLPGVGFDVVPTDCLAVHLKKRLPSASQLTLAFQSTGPGGLPPGTQRTMIELIPYGNRIRQGGRLVTPKQLIKTRTIDFGSGPQTATRITWGDVFTAWYSTGISNIEDYTVIPEKLHGKMRALNRWKMLFRLPFVRDYLKNKVKPGPDSDTRSKTHTLVWGEVTDDQGGKAVSRVRGPEAGVEWTGLSALAAVQKVMQGVFEAGFQTPGKVFGPDFVLECEGVSREDVY